MIGLLARNREGWAVAPRIKDDLVVDALTMAYWRRTPANKVMLP
jgi:transposase InsO family protein